MAGAVYTIEQQRALALARAREAEAAANAQPAIDQNATNDPANTGHIPVFNKPLTPDQQDQLLPPQHEGVIAPWTIGGSGRGHFDPWNAGPIGTAGKFVAGATELMNGLGKQAVQDPNGQDLLNDPTVPQRSMEAASLTTPMNPAVRAGDGLLPGLVRARGKQTPTTPMPSSDEVEAAGRADYRAVRQMDVGYHPDHVATLGEQIRQKLYDEGILEEDAPSAHAALKRLMEKPQLAEGETASVQPKSLLSIRKSLRRASNNTLNGAEREAGGIGKKAVDEFVSNPPEGSVLYGDASQVGPRWDSAKANWSSARGSKALEQLSESADRRAEASESGNNNLRSRIATVLDNPKLKAGFSEGEKAALDKVSRGNLVRDGMRWAGNALRGGGLAGAGEGGEAAAGLATGVSAHALAGMPLLYSTLVGLGVPATSIGLKWGSEKLTNRALKLVAEMVRERSPLARSRPTEMMPHPTSAGQEAVLQALMFGNQNPAAQPYSRRPDQ